MFAKRTITSHLKSLNIKQTITCRDGHPGPGLVQAQKCWSYLQVNGISKGNTIKNCTDSLLKYHNPNPFFYINNSLVGNIVEMTAL
jgi:hypothetical protein